MTAGENSFHRLRAVPLPRGGRSLGRGDGGMSEYLREGTPSTACGRSPSLEEGGLWGGVTGERASFFGRGEGA